MPAHPDRRQAGEGDPAAAIVSLLCLRAWIPASYERWRPLIEAVLTSFLRHFEKDTLDRLLQAQHKLPASATPAERAARLASELTALHKVCQILARNPHVPEDARAALVPLERLPPAAIPDDALSIAVRRAAQMRTHLQIDPNHPKVGRGSVADVFRFRDLLPRGPSVAFKTIRPEAAERVGREAAILTAMARESITIGALAGPEFAHTLAEALRDAARALLREIDFAGEASNLRAARAFYRHNQRVCVPALDGRPLTDGIFMEFVDGAPLMEAPLGTDARRRAARLVFRTLLLEPLFSGLHESLFHADPHAGNLLIQLTPGNDMRLVLLDWSQADRLAAPLRHGLLDLCLHCLLREAPPGDVIARILESPGLTIRLPFPAHASDPLHAAFDIVEQLALKGYPVPLSLLLLRKSFLTLDGVARELDPSFDPWRETLAYAAWVFASETPLRLWSVPFPWLDQGRFYRSGLPTRALAGRLMSATSQMILRLHKKLIDAPRLRCDLALRAPEWDSGLTLQQKQ